MSRRTEREHTLRRDVRRVRVGAAPPRATGIDTGDAWSVHGYLTGATGPDEWIALADTAGWVDDVLRSDRTLLGWARRTASASMGGGRGRVLRVPAASPGPDRRTFWAVRRYRRGGAVALLDDRYLRVGPTRPEREVRASAAARERGVRTPAVIAAAWYPAGALYRADLVTEHVPDRVTLAEALFGPPDALPGPDRPDRGTGRVADAERAGEPPRPAVLRRAGFLAMAGRLARELGERGLRHADLNAHNILVGPEPDDPPWVLDLDRADPNVAPGRAEGRRMLGRLERSLSKLGRARGLPLAKAEIAALRAAFEEGA